MGRDLFQNRIRKGLIGPGSDSFGLTDEQEIISDYPLVRYYSGILFPEKQYSQTEMENDDLDVLNETEEPNLLETEPIENDINECDKEIKSKGYESENEGKANQNHFHPNNLGLTFCVDISVEKILVTFSGGYYDIPEQADIKVKITKLGYDAFMEDSLLFPFKDILQYENGFMSLKRELIGDKGGKNIRSGEYSELDKFKKTERYKDSSAKNYILFFEKLIGRTWRRKPFSIDIEVKIEDTVSPIEIKLQENHYKEFSIGYHIKTYNVKNRKYVKIQLINISKKQSSARFTNKTPELNLKCLFQAAITIKSNKILPYKAYQDLNPYDKEVEELNFLYRNVIGYGIGHNCSVNWNKDNTTLYTTYIPEYDVKNTKNDFNVNDFENINEFEKLNKSLDIRGLSIFSELTQNEIIERLKQFVELYGNWIEEQKKKRNVLTEKEKEISKEIIERLVENQKRLKDNIKCLYDNTVFRAFQFANTAMLLQIIISNDTDFSKTEKELSSINHSIDYNDLDFFRNYDYSKSKTKPKYRPFQLAFLLLSLKGIVDPHSDDRTKIVDLIWFPTGGGKTEAYLAVAALTISYRRIANEEKISKGVSVIMRYTLRLLTSQQFERSSKLIAALEFLRRNFKNELKYEPITIGLWVGNQLTPGKIEKACEIIDEIEDECKKKKGNPEEKNIFQISACPWCGTKLVSEGQYGFEAPDQKDFKIKCLNKRCTYYNEIPVQVIDEMLFKRPPTLLFATVDKFAQIAWKEDSYKFFNSLDDEKLPPDLIIQDELHLLSGPLGSIVGIFESIVEMLCTNDCKKLVPKIIASTATTRNTTQQISQLYGRRRVNIFPPSGINYNDSFFAKEEKENSRRKYIGFMPVGKTSIDTQLQIIAHLLVARIEAGEPLDKYWTLVSYYNSKRDVGKIWNKIGDEIINNTSALQQRLFGNGNSFAYNYRYLYDRVEELTARVDSSKIKAVLKQMENTLELYTKDNYKNIKAGVVDLVLATNMFSVGIDISRLNVILINGMPKNIAEYIQASSRVGRKDQGLVVALLNPNRARDKSYFEHFVPFHQAFYKSIEPLSVTSFTENTIDKMLATLLIAYVRNKVPGMNKDNAAQYFQVDKINELKYFIKERFATNIKEYVFFETKIDKLAKNWEERINDAKLKTYKELIKSPADTSDSTDEWVVMQSLRAVDTDSYIEIMKPFSNKNLDKKANEKIYQISDGENA